MSNDNVPNWQPNNPIQNSGNFAPPVTHPIETPETPPVKPNVKPTETPGEETKVFPTLDLKSNGWCEGLKRSYFSGLYQPKNEKEFEALKPFAK